LIADFVQGGGGVAIVSSELEEILGVSDRILIFRRGRVATVFSREDATQKKLLLAAV
jgi:putative xylitol transport system ATP-binding protein